jgi:hypothetical protein
MDTRLTAVTENSNSRRTASKHPNSEIIERVLQSVCKKEGYLLHESITEIFQPKGFGVFEPKGIRPGAWQSVAESLSKPSVKVVFFVSPHAKKLRRD